MNSNCIGKSTFVHYFLEGHHCGDDGDGDGDDCDGEAEPRRGPCLAAAAVVADVSVRASARSLHRTRAAKRDFTTSW